MTLSFILSISPWYFYFSLLVFGRDLSGTVTYYTSKRRDVVDALVKEFQRLYPGIEVNVYRSGTGEVIARFMAELEAGKVLADVITVTDLLFMRELSKRDLLLEFVPYTVTPIDQRFIYEGGKYIEHEIITVAIGYNTALIQDPPKGFKDLLEPRFHNKVVIPNPVYSGVAYTTLATLVKHPDLGWDFYRGLKDNGTMVVRGNPAAAQAIASGERPVGIVAYGDLIALKRQGSPIDLVFPIEGVPLIPQPTGVLKTSPNLEAARAFAEFLVSPNALAISAAIGGYITVNPVIRTPYAPPITELAFMETDWEFFAEKREELLQTFCELFGL